MTVWKRGKVYYFDFWIDRKRYVKRVGPSKEAAQAAEQVARRRALEGRYTQEWGLPASTPPPPTVQDYVEQEYLPSITGRWAPSTVATARSVCRKLVAAFGALRLTGITPQAIEAFSRARLATVSPNQLREDLGWLRRVIRAAQRHGHVASLPPISLPRPRAREERLLDPKDEDRLFQAIRPAALQPLCWLLLWTGLRPQEALRLRWEQVDFSSRCLRLRQPKTGTLKVVPLLPRAIRLFRQIRPPAFTVDGPVFPSPVTGQPWSLASLEHAWGRAVRTATLPGLRVLSLRHTFATRLIRSHADLPTVGAALGHVPPYHTTLRYFAHTSEGRIRAALRQATQQFSHPQKKNRR